MTTDKRQVWLWREFYGINRQCWPDMGRLEAAWSAFRLALKTWRVK